MTDRSSDAAVQIDLRARAVSRMTGDAQASLQMATAAYGVIHELASSPTTASDALAVLHELQVHQVELDLQAEELRGSRMELEAALRRQIQLYDAAPVGYATVDSGSSLLELNLTGAAMLGWDRDVLLGQALSGFLARQSATALHALLAHVQQHQRPQACTLLIAGLAGGMRVVNATVSADPAGGAFLIALMDVEDEGSLPEPSRGEDGLL